MKKLVILTIFVLTTLPAFANLNFKKVLLTQDNLSSFSYSGKIMMREQKNHSGDGKVKVSFHREFEVVVGSEALSFLEWTTYTEYYAQSEFEDMSEYYNLPHIEELKLIHLYARGDLDDYLLKIQHGVIEVEERVSRKAGRETSYEFIQYKTNAVLTVNESTKEVVSLYIIRNYLEKTGDVE